MRYLCIGAWLFTLAAGCAARPEVVTLVPTDGVARLWEARYRDEAERADRLALRLARLESQLELLAQERADSDLYVAWLQEDLSRVEEEQQALEEHNAQLSARQRELTALHEELSDLWYSSALSRARRRSLPAGAPAALEPELKGTP